MPASHNSTAYRKRNPSSLLAQLKHTNGTLHVTPHLPPDATPCSRLAIINFRLLTLARIAASAAVWPTHGTYVGQYASGSSDGTAARHHSGRVRSARVRDAMAQRVRRRARRPRAHHGARVSGARDDRVLRQEQGAQRVRGWREEALAQAELVP